MSQADQSNDVVEVLQMQEGCRMVTFHCPGCQNHHGLRVKNKDGSGSANGPVWTWNQDRVRPTLNPSVLSRSSRLTDLGKQQYRDWCDGKIQLQLPERFDSIDVVCHLYVRDGSLEFLSDSTHGLAGQTVRMKSVDLA